MIFYYHTRPIHYQIVGSGPVLVLLHGFLESSTIWEQMLPSFSENFKVIIIDLPGFGKSANISEVHSMELLANVVVNLLENEAIFEASFMGHSMGGYVVLAIAESYPNVVSKIILLNSSPYADSKARQENRNRAISIIEKNKEAFVSMAISNLFTEKERLQFPIKINSLKEEALLLSSKAIIAAIYGMRDRKNRVSILKKFDKKKHVIAGVEDLIIPVNEIKSLSVETKTTLHLLNNGHMSWLTNTNEIIKIVRFID